MMSAFLGFDIELSLYSIAAFLFIVLLLTGAILYIKALCSSDKTCTIAINDDPEYTKHCKSGSSLLFALTGSGIRVPSPCGGKATCKQCKARIIKGAEAPLDTDIATFSKMQLRAGWRLSCQTKVHNDIALRIPESYLGVKEWECKVLSNRNVATFIKELTIELPENEEVKYKPGGYVQFAVPPFVTSTNDWKTTIDAKYWEDWERFNLWNRTIDYSHLRPQEIVRAYSMASYPAEGRKLIFNVRIATPPFFDGEVSEKIPWGICSSYMFGLKPGDTVKISGPYGESFMIDDDRDLYFLIGGAGSSFGRAHILDLFYSKHTKRNVSLWYGARSLKENIYPEIYEKLEKEFSNFHYHLVLSEPTAQDVASGWPQKDPLKTNFLFRAFESGQLKKMENPEDALYYVCGPPMHNKSILKMLDDYGVARESIVLDDFGS